MKEYSFTFYSNLNEKELELDLDELKFTKNKKKSIAKVTFKNYSFTTIDSDNTKTTNYFVKIKNGDFFAITQFYQRNSILYFEGYKIKTIVFKFRYKNNNLDLDYLHSCEITDTICRESVHMIDKKVHFVPKFYNNSSKVEFLKKGHLIELDDVYHN